MTERDMSDDVRRAIQELREREVRSDDVPSLGSVLHPRRFPRRSPFVSPMRLALAAALAVAAVFGYRAVVRSPQPIRLPREVAALSTWRPMTDVLLDTPGRELLRDAAPLGRSIINLNTGALR